MKTNSIFRFFSLLMLLGSTCAQGQSQLNAIFPDDNATWVCEMELWDPMGTSTIFDRFFYNGDTILGGVTYSQLWKTWDPTLPVDTAGANYFGALRVDSAGRVLYRGTIPHAGSSECLGRWVANEINPEVVLYDWTRSAGDTNLYVQGTDTVLSVVLDIDTVVVAGVTRRRFEVADRFGSVHYELEGIGSEIHFFWPWCMPFESINKLVCFEDSTINYSGPGESCSGFLAVDDALENEVVVKVNPHPVEGNSRLRLETDLLETFYMEVVDLQGRVLIHEEIRQGQSFAVGQQGLPDGMYLVRVSLDGVLVASEKLLVQ